MCRRLLPLLVLVLPAALLGLSEAQPDRSAAQPDAKPEPKPTWETALDWQPAVDEETQTKIDRRVVELALKLDAQAAALKAASVADRVKFGRLCVLTLALMQALPHLARQGTKEQFNKVRTTAEDLVRVVLTRVLPETVDRRPEASLTVAKLRDAHLDAGHQNYHVPILLMVIEFFYAGGLDVKYGSEVPRDLDRGAGPTFRPPLAAQIGIVRLTALLLSNTGPMNRLQIDAPLNDFSLWSYQTLGFARDATCYSKSSTAVMGLRAAVNLGLLDFEPAAFALGLVDFENRTFVSDLLGATNTAPANFRQRLTDVLFHAVLCVAEVENEKEDPKNPQIPRTGYVGPEAFRRADRTYAGVPAATIQDRVIDVARYRTVYANDRKGGLLCRVDVRTDHSPPEGEQVAAFRYLPTDGGYGAYHTASAAYVLVTCANLLALILDQERQAADDPRKGAALKPTYGFSTKDWKTWEVKGAEKPTYQLRLRNREREPFRYTPLAVERLPGRQWTPLPVERRIEQALNMTVAMLCVEKDGPKKPRSLDKTSWTKEGKLDPLQPKNTSPMHWQAALTLDKNAHGLMGFASFGVMKTCLATGHLDYLGPWPWYRDFAQVFCDEGRLPLLRTLNTDEGGLLGGPNSYATAEFVLLTLTRSYRPLFPRSGEAIKP
jgi:hypothetical protein